MILDIQKIPVCLFVSHFPLVYSFYSASYIQAYSILFFYAGGEARVRRVAQRCRCGVDWRPFGDFELAGIMMLVVLG